jgi:hypothetical protein
MKTHNKYLAITLVVVMLFAILATGCATSHKGYNYKKHYAKSMKFKARNEAGKYMKCNR